MPRLTSPQQIRQRLEAERPWAAFALADLEPPYAAFATWWRPSDDSLAVALVYSAFATPVVLCVGSSERWNQSVPLLLQAGVPGAGVWAVGVRF